MLVNGIQEKDAVLSHDANADDCSHKRDDIERGAGEDECYERTEE